MNDHEYILTLLQKETLSDGEIEFLAARNAQDPSDPLWETAAEQFVIRMKELNGHPASEATKLALKKILEQLSKSEHSITPVHRIHFLKTAWFKSAAAILLILAGAATYYIFHTSQSQVEVAETRPSPLPKEDVMPGSEKAILTLSNGQKVELNNATSETINDGTLSIKNTNGQLSYTSAGLPIPSTGGVARSAGVGHNTMSTPRGGQYKLTLSDGTRVWLNAASSITYPITFSAKTREVSITGEAYFEVIKNKEKPFIVKTPSDEIIVLGTSFNVNAYSDEPSVKTSLLEGSVKVGDTNIKPGEAYQDGKVDKTNIEQDLAWKNGIFNFHNVSLKDAMKQLARWYDVEVKFQGDVSDIKLGGEIGRKLSLKQVLKGLEDADVRFKLSGKTLTVIRQ